ncbi:MAG: hypothetical protein AAGC95_02620 [Pseudomonadota bacterium]
MRHHATRRLICKIQAFSRHLAAGASAAIAAAAVIAPAAAAPEPPDDFYPMVCRAGPDMQFILTPQKNYFGLSISFRKAQRGFEVDPAGLAPGQCAWLDRGISRDEPEIADFLIVNPPRTGNTAADRDIFNPGAIGIKDRVRAPIAISLTKLEDGTRVRILEPDRASTRPYRLVQDIDFMDGSLFTVMAKRRPPSAGSSMFNLAPSFMIWSIQNGGVTSDGAVLQINDRGQIVVEQSSRSNRPGLQVDEDGRVITQSQPNANR